MARIASSQSLARSACLRHPQAARLAALSYMLALTAAAGLLALLGVRQGVLLGGAYIYFAAGLWVDVPLTAIAHRTRLKALRNLSAGRVAALVLLPALFLLPVWGLWAAYEWLNVEYMTVFARVTQGSLGVYAVPLLLGACLLVCVAVFSFIGVFNRNLTIYLLEEDQAFSPYAVLLALRNGFVYLYSPAALFFRRIGWFLLMLALWLLPPVGYAAWRAGQAGGFSLNVATAYLLLTPRALTCAAWALGGAWIAGLGFLFWPRYHLTRVYQTRSQMRDSGLL